MKFEVHLSEEWLGHFSEVYQQIKHFSKQHVF